jgi:hypothetical protein
MSALCQCRGVGKFLLSLPTPSPKKLTIAPYITAGR